MLRVFKARKEPWVSLVPKGPEALREHKALKEPLVPPEPKEL